jgi:hypothetical protein
LILGELSNTKIGGGKEWSGDPQTRGYGAIAAEHAEAFPEESAGLRA